MGVCKTVYIIPLILSGTFLFSPNMAVADDCVRPPGFPETLPCPSQPYEMVLQEHEDRINRLKRLSADYAQFEFSTTMLKPDEHGLAGFPVEIPVLRVVANADVFFDTDKDEIRPEAIPIIYIIAESLKREPPDVSLFVAGHTDSNASEEYNLDLGTRRAQAVAAALVRRGVYQASVYSVSFGEYAAISNNETAEGRARNRRVEFLFSAKSEAIVEVLERQQIQLCSDTNDESPGNCRKKIAFAPSRIELAHGQSEAVLQAENLRQSILIEQSSDPVNIRKEQKKLEIEADRRKIVILDTKIRIHLGSE
ncbi:OmpA family protein [Albirhodobacter sp. R86504]|uniref:OmpA family protein n=1 Tax=Albirhodobacter sp. R86504 TaxID=3093848 RepID=UPI00366E943F